MKTLIKRSVIVTVVLGLVVAGAGWYFQRAQGQTFAYNTADVKRGDIAVSIAATGTVEPEEVIDVGA
jgi:HlyD family secretion protein